MSQRILKLLTFALVATGALHAQPISGRAVLSGMVLDDKAKPIDGAEVFIPSLSISAFSDTAGKYRLIGIPQGSHAVRVRQIGFEQLEMIVAFGANEDVTRRMTLKPVAVLDSVSVKAPYIDRKLASFDENRRIGLGTFITRAELAPMEGRSVAAVLSQISGVRIVHGKGNRAWLHSGRGSRSLGGTPGGGDRADIQAGARPACYAQVYLDDARVYSGRPLEPLFNLNSLRVDQMEAVEYYASPARTPLKYSTLNSGCGVLVIWTRRSP